MAGPSTCSCGCGEADGIASHRVVRALDQDDLDAALQAGLLECGTCCRCTSTCTAKLLDARASRQAALAARERFRARQARLARRQEELLARRSAQPAALEVAGKAAPSPSLPPAAAAALARAKARAAGPADR